MALTNRAAVLDELDDHAGARAAAERSLKLAPDEPEAPDNACYVIARAGGARAALPYCERAAAAAPDVAAIGDSYATALADLGRCDEAEAQLAQARRLDPVSVAYQRKVVCGGR